MLRLTLLCAETGVPFSIRSLLIFEKVLNEKKLMKKQRSTRISIVCSQLRKTPSPELWEHVARRDWISYEKGRLSRVLVCGGHEPTGGRECRWPIRETKELGLWSFHLT